MKNVDTTRLAYRWILVQMHNRKTNGDEVKLKNEDEKFHKQKYNAAR